MTKHYRILLSLAWLTATLVGCRNEGSKSTDEAADAGDTVGESDDSGGSEDSEPPGKEGEGSAEYPRARQVARLSADQFHASLIVATGQAWVDYPEYSAALGKPDLAEVTEESRSFSISFDKFAHDAARSTCRLAIDAEVGGGEPVIMRFADPSDRGEAEYVANLQYLLLRFLAIEVDPGDSRIEPWLTLLQAPPPEGEQLDDELMADRWWAVCVGLATHPDFLSY